MQKKQQIKSQIRKVLGGTCAVLMVASCEVGEFAAPRFSQMGDHTQRADQDLFDLTVDGASGSGSYRAGEEVTLELGPLDRDMQFFGWDIDPRHVKSEGDDRIQIIMPASPLRVSAVITMDRDEPNEELADESQSDRL